ncbi:MAG TPA: hypothetical protein VM146_16825 [Steroidobacteraceae bacterium]|nr:hypothetical protein [Steroidobacteraceae bacterium]
MARVPVIESPCPIAARPLPLGASDHCGACDRTVHNLDRMSERERREFMSACTGKVCVAYTMRVPAAGLRRRANGVVAFAAMTVAALPLAAQESPVVGMSPVEGANGLPNCDDLLDGVVVTGGVNKGNDASWVDDGKDAPPDLPTMEDDGR